MPRFQFTAVNEHGESITDVIEAAGFADATTQLEASGLTVHSLVVTALPPLSEALSQAAERLANRRNELADPLPAYLKECPRGSRRRELETVAKTLASKDLRVIKQAIGASPIAWAPLLAAATPPEDDAQDRIDGVEESVFARFLQRERTTAVLRRRAGLAMAYPLFIIGLTLLVAWPVSTMILPTFRNIFAEFGLSLPAATVLALAVGRFFERGGGALVFGLCLGLYLVWRAAPRWVPSPWLPFFAALPAPWAAGQGGAGVSAKIARQLADLIEARSPTADSLEIVGRHTEDRMGQHLIQRLASRLDSRVDQAAGCSPPYRSLDFAVSAPMAESSRGRLLRELSACHAQRLGGRVSWAQGVAGPFTMMVLGILVGWLAIALYLPLVSLVEGLT